MNTNINNIAAPTIKKITFPENFCSIGAINVSWMKLLRNTNWDIIVINIITIKVMTSKTLSAITVPNKELTGILSFLDKTQYS